VLYRAAKTLILDEPTAVLVPQEVDELFDNLRELKREGLTVIFISHKLDEVLAVADDITVIRRGTTVGAIGLSGAVERLCDDRGLRMDQVSYVRDAARSISRELGAHPW
jgi:general nucleoside transport system ATP-binding protein